MAEKCRRLANSTTDALTRERLAHLAEEYERDADTLSDAQTREDLERLES
jgi:hypothetical protein